MGSPSECVLSRYWRDQPLEIVQLVAVAAGWNGGWSSPLLLACPWHPHEEELARWRWSAPSRSSPLDLRVALAARGERQRLRPCPKCAIAEVCAPAPPTCRRRGGARAA